MGFLEAYPNEKMGSKGAGSRGADPPTRLRREPQPNGVGFQQRGNGAEGFEPFVGEAFTAEPQGKLSSPLPPFG